LFEKITIIGVGLIGSSLSWAIRREGIAKTLIGYDSNTEHCERFQKIGVADQVENDPQKAVADSDLIILCTPVGAMKSVFQQIAPHLKSGAIVTDVGSVKASVIEDIKPFVPKDVTFIPSHPIAGTEQSGPEAGFASLFDGRWVIITPDAGASAEKTALLKAFWEKCGSQVEEMEPKHHDLVLAITSHLPHLIAYNIVGTAAHLEQVTSSEVIKFSAGGFRDFTRIAASDPIMWRDVFLNNKEAVLEMLGRFTEDLTDLQRAIRYGDGDKLHDLFSKTREIRRGIVAAGQETIEPNFGRNKND